MSDKIISICDFIFKNSTDCIDRKQLGININGNLSKTNTYIEINATGSWIRKIDVDKLQIEVWSKYENVALVLRTGACEEKIFKTFVITKDIIHHIMSEAKQCLENCNYYVSFFFSGSPDYLASDITSYLRVLAEQNKDVKIIFAETNEPTNKNKACVRMISEAFNDVILYSTSLNFLNTMKDLMKCENRPELIKKITENLQSRYT